MEKKKKFNYIYSDDKTLGYGVGYYIVFEGHDGKPLIDTFYPTWEVNEMVDGISVGVLNKIKYLISAGYQFDIWFKPNLKDLL